jgi:hypothetical protein
VNSTVSTIDPGTYGFPTRPRFAESAAGENKPVPPVAWWELLIDAGPERPIVQESSRFGFIDFVKELVPVVFWKRGEQFRYGAVRLR